MGPPLAVIVFVHAKLKQSLRSILLYKAKASVVASNAFIPRCRGGMPPFVAALLHFVLVFVQPLAVFVGVHAKRAFVNTKSQPYGWDLVFLR